MFFVYKITNLINHKIYIGKTNSLLNRWSCHRHYSKWYNSKLYFSIRKYKIDNFYMEPIAICETEDAAYKVEILLIKYYDSYKTGLNSNLGGKGAGSGKTHPNFGKHLSEEVKRKISNTQKGGTGLNKNKHFSDETKRKISENRKGISMKEETKIKLAKIKGKLTIEQVIEIKNLLVQNVSQVKIAKQFNISSGTINKIKSGIRWKFV